LSDVLYGLGGEYSRDIVDLGWRFDYAKWLVTKFEQGVQLLQTSEKRNIKWFDL
ncbi:4756_t:CDS:1, partial [Paraglomus brasilianum]